MPQPRKGTGKKSEVQIQMEAAISGLMMRLEMVEGDKSLVSSYSKQGSKEGQAKAVAQSLDSKNTDFAALMAQSDSGLSSDVSHHNHVMCDTQNVCNSIDHSNVNQEISHVKSDISVALSMVAMKANKGDAVVSADATDLASTMTLLNEIKATFNAMNGN